MIRYSIPPSVQPVSKAGIAALTTSQGGRILVDSLLLDLWQLAGGQSIDDILQQAVDRPGFQRIGAQPVELRAALACLAEAGLLLRESDSPAPAKVEMAGGELVSVVIVDYNSRAWLETCLPSLARQSYAPLEVVLVDNASGESAESWAPAHFPGLKILRLEQTVPLAKALNDGVQESQGAYTLLLNPDIVLAPDTIAQMVSVAQADPNCAAVAAKLRFSWAPGFLNGLGNSVGALGWGTDSALGHLDLGQFDHWHSLPSVCFAAALVPASAWQTVGPVDEGFPMYYEDSEWCYRARLFGHTILAAPQAVAYHAFSSQAPGGEPVVLAPAKLNRVAYGRLRFISRLNGKKAFFRFLANYLIEDLARILGHLTHGRQAQVSAYLDAWRQAWRSRRDLRRERQEIQARRKISDKQLYSLQGQIPPPLIRYAAPLLTWDIVCSTYLPLIVSGKTRRIPEFQGTTPSDDSAISEDQAAIEWQPVGGWRRLRNIWQVEGFGSLLHRIGRELQHRLARP